MPREQKESRQDRLDSAAAHICYFNGDGEAAMRRGLSPKPIKTSRKKPRRVTRARAH